MRKRALVMWVTAMGILFAASFSPDRFLHRSPLVDDEASYFSHALTIGLDFDLDYRNEIATILNCDQTMASHPIGAGLMAAPFVAFFGVVDRIAGHPVIQDHRRYQNSWAFFGFVFSASVYLFLGIYIYYDALRRLFPGFKMWQCAFIVFSTGILHYVLYASFYSHPFEFLGLGLSLWPAVRLYLACRDRENVLVWLFLLSISVTLNLFIRYGSINVILLPALVLLLSRVFDPAGEAGSKASLAGLLWRQSAWTAAALIPIVGFSWFFFGQPYPTPKAVYCHDVGGLEGLGPVGVVSRVIHMLPNLLTLLFGSELGILYSNPVLLFGFVILLGFLLKGITGGGKALRMSAIVLLFLYYGFDTALVLHWQTTGSAYGYRYLYPLFPVAIFGMALWLHRLRQGKPMGRMARRAATGITFAFYVFCGYAILGQVFAQATEALSAKKQINAYGVRHWRSYNGYSFALPRELLKSETWFSLMANRFPGFEVGYLIVGSPVEKHVAPTLVETYKKTHANVAPQAYLQVLLLFVFWLAGGIGFAAVHRGEAGAIRDRCRM